MSKSVKTKKKTTKQIKLNQQEKKELNHLLIQEQCLIQ